jgi:hypothetical protein
MSLFSLQILDIHVTTLITYLAAGIVTIYLARRHGLWPVLWPVRSSLIIYVGGIMILTVLSFETAWLSLETLLTASQKKLGVSSVIIDLSILAVTGLAVYQITGKIMVDKWFIVLAGVTVAIWALWMPSFPVDSGSRLYADPIKLFQTASIIYLFSRYSNHDRSRLPSN